MKHLFRVLFIACLFFVTGISKSNAQCYPTNSQSGYCWVSNDFGYSNNYFYWVFNSPTGNLSYDIVAIADGSVNGWAQAHVWTGISKLLVANSSDTYERDYGNLSGFGLTQDFDGDVQCNRGYASISLSMW